MGCGRGAGGGGWGQRTHLRIQPPGSRGHAAGDPRGAQGGGGRCQWGGGSRERKGRTCQAPGAPFPTHLTPWTSLLAWDSVTWALCLQRLALPAPGLAEGEPSTAPGPCHLKEGRSEGAGADLDGDNLLGQTSRPWWARPDYHLLYLGSCLEHGGPASQLRRSPGSGRVSLHSLRWDLLLTSSYLL